MKGVVVGLFLGSGNSGWSRFPTTASHFGCKTSAQSANDLRVKTDGVRQRKEYGYAYSNHSNMIIRGCCFASYLETRLTGNCEIWNVKHEIIKLISLIGLFLCYSLSKLNMLMQWVHLIHILVGCASQSHAENDLLIYKNDV